MAMASASTADDLAAVARLACFGTADGTFHAIHNKGRFSVFSANPIKEKVSVNKGQDILKRLKTITAQKCYVKKEHMLFSLASLIQSLEVGDRDNHKNDLLCSQAYGLVRDICENSSDLFTFIHLKKLVNPTGKASWGRGIRTLVTNFYKSKTPIALAQESTVCKSRHGFEHRDLLRQVHLNSEEGKSKGFDLVVNYLLKGKEILQKATEKADEDEEVVKVVSILHSIETLNATEIAQTDVVQALIKAHSLVEMQIPTRFFKIRETFEAMVDHAPLEWLVRRVPKMAELGLLDPFSPVSDTVIARLTDHDAFEKEKVSPVTVLSASRKYNVNAQKKWIRNMRIAKALNSALNHSLDNIPSSGKRILLAVHADAKLQRKSVTGSGSLNIISTCTLFAQILARMEEHPEILFFSSTETKEIKVTKTTTQALIVEQFVNWNKLPSMEDYDLTVPLKHAATQKKPYDGVLIVSGKKHIANVESLKECITEFRRECRVPEAKVAVVSLMDGSDNIPFSAKDDFNLLNVTGFDADVLDLVLAFFKGLPK